MKSWSDYVDLLKRAESLHDEMVDPSSDILKAQLWKQFAMNISQGYFLLFQSTPEHPEFSPFENSVFLAQPNPDAVYYYAPVSGSGIYRVTGSRGNAPVTGFAVGNRIIGMDEVPGQGLGNYDLDALTLDAHGNFEVIFSTERPEGYTGDWFYMPAETDFILARQFSCLWGREEDMRLAIERLDKTLAPRPVMTKEEVDTRLTRLFSDYVRNLSGIAIAAVRRCADQGFINRFNINSYQELGNSQDWPQAYFETVFDLSDDEALIIETRLPDTRPYWNLQVIDALWNQIDYVYRQSSLNEAQSSIGTDGRFLAVLSHKDPGIANWLDTGGHNYGMLIGRWYRCSSQPLPEVRRVKFSDLDRLLPSDILRVNTDERERALRERLIGAQLRRKW